MSLNKADWERLDEDNFRHIERNMTISLSELKANREELIKRLSEVPNEIPMPETEDVNLIEAVSNWNQEKVIKLRAFLEKEIENYTNQINLFEEMEWLSH